MESTESVKLLRNRKEVAETSSNSRVGTIGLKKPEFAIKHEKCFLIRRRCRKDQRKDKGATRLKKSMKRICPLMIVAAFIAFSLYSMLIPTYYSQDLQTVTEEAENHRTTTTYQTPDGRTVIAADKGYAQVRKTTNEEGKVILEEYLMPDGSAAILSAGYSAIRRLYTEGLNTEICYLGPDGTPVVVGNGYDRIQRSYNERKLADTDTYFIADTAVERAQGYAALKRIYGEGANRKKVIRQEYRGLDGGLVLNSSGYAYWTREYDEDGRVSEERYFLPDGGPAVLPLGYSGYQRDYDGEGRTTETRYLDPAGSVANTIRGYAIVRKEYTDEGTKTFYYSADGVPVTGGKSQYGILSTGDQQIYLDEEGQTITRLDNVLGNHQALVIAAGAIVTILALAVQGKWRIAFLAAYIGFILYMTMAYREAGLSRARFELFRSYRQFWSNRGIRLQILNNIFLFIPLGTVLMSLLYQERAGKAAVLTVMICIAVSAIIETVQLTFRIGLFEVDDILSNGMGGLIGAAVYLLKPGVPIQEGR